FARLAQRTGAEAVLLLSDHGMTPIARLLTQPQSTPLMRNLAEEYRVAGTRLLRPNLAVVQGYHQGLCTGPHRDLAIHAVRSPRVRSGVRADVHFHDLFGLLLRVLGLPVPPGRRAYRGPLFPEPAPAPGPGSAPAAVPASSPAPGPGSAPVPGPA